MIRIAAMAIALLLLAGCASAKSVATLADRTAANIGTIGVHLARLDANSRDVTARRTANIARLHAANTELRARYELDLALTKKTGGGSNLALLKDIEQWRTQVDGIFNTAKVSEAAFTKSVLAGQQDLDTKSKTLAQIAKSLASLAKKESRKDRLRFLTGYAKNLRNEMDTALAQDTKSANAANALLDEARNAVESGSSESKSRGD